MTTNSMYLDIDPSIMENNMMIIKENPVEEELRNMFSTATMPSKVVKPAPGFCIKTYSKEKKKVFINICTTDAIPSPKDITSSDLMQILNSEDQSSYRVPMSIGEGRSENDKSGVPATVYDVAINPVFFKKVERDDLFQTFFLTVVFEGLQDKYQVEIDFQNYVILNNRKCMGTLQTHRIQNRDIINVEESLKSPLIEEITTANAAREKNTFAKNIKPVKKNEFPFRLVRQPSTGIIEHLVAEFKIPNNITKSELHLEVGEDRVTLNYSNTICNDVFLPICVSQEDVIAKLDRNKEILSVKMAVAGA